MRQLHSLLKRQLRRYQGLKDPLLGERPGLLEAVNDAYWQFDTDRAMLEHSLELTSQELLEANAELRQANAELELRVQERTAALTRANAALREEIAERQRAEDRLRREAARAEALARLAARLNAQLDLDAALNAVSEEAARALDVPIVTVSLYDEIRDVLFYAGGFGLPPEFSRRLQPVPRATYEEQVKRSGPLVVTPDMQASPNVPNADLYLALNLRTTVSVSLLRDSQLVGRLNIATVGQVRHFSEDELALLQGLANQAAQAIINARLFAEARRRYQHLEALRSIDLAIGASLDLRITFGVILDQVITQLHVDAADILLLNERSQLLDYSGGRGFYTGALRHTHLHLGEGYAGQAALERHLVSIPNLAQAPGNFAKAPLLPGETFVAYFAMPLIAKGQVQGVLEIFHRAPLDPEPEWLSFLEALAGQAAIAIDNASLYEDLQRTNLELTLAYDTTLEGWTKALDLRDKETEGHTRRVTEMTERLARTLGMSDAELVHIRRGALLHDMGKIGIPDTILLKPGPLTPEEREIMYRHPTYAYEMLSPIAFLRPALDIPYCHHEKWDGTGYPRGLKDEHIPLAARIFAVVDVWDALRSDRPYRAGWPDRKVQEHIVSQAGSHFDPKIVAAFLKMKKE